MLVQCRLIHSVHSLHVVHCPKQTLGWWTDVHILPSSKSKVGRYKSQTDRQGSTPTAYRSEYSLGSSPRHKCTFIACHGYIQDSDMSPHVSVLYCAYILIDPLKVSEEKAITKERERSPVQRPAQIVKILSFYSAAAGST